MTKFTKKILAGVLSGAILLTGGLSANVVSAANFNNHDPRMEFNGRHERPRISDEQIAEFADYYGVSRDEIAEALEDGVHFGDIKQAATLARLSGQPFADVLAMKSDWHQVAQQLGITREQFDAFMKDEMLNNLVKQSKLDRKTVESLLDDNYAPHDICAAGLIANASGKSAKSVLAKRKINNTWEDVAKEFNVESTFFLIAERKLAKKG